MSNPPPPPPGGDPFTNPPPGPPQGPPAGFPPPQIPSPQAPPPPQPPPGAPPPGAPYGSPQPPPMPGWQPGAPAPRGSNGLAVAALVVGIIALVGTIGCAGLVLGPIALGLGIAGRSRATKDPDAGGSGMAIAGIVMGAVAFLLSAALIVFVVVAGESSDFDTGSINTDPSDGTCDYSRFMQDPDC